MGLKIATKIHGLGVAGGSALLAILFPDFYGTVDQFVVKALQGISIPDVSNIKPENIKLKEGNHLIEIMGEKANQLNKKFQSNNWTPRKIDMILWSIGR